jgi:hypothetical protein
VTKAQIIQQLGQATRQLRDETKEKEVAFSDIESLTKKLTKSTKKLTKSSEVVGNLRDCLKDARTEVHRNNKCHRLELSTVVTSVSEFAHNFNAKLDTIEKDHQLALISVHKMTESKLQGSDRLHRLQVSQLTQLSIAKDDAHVLDLAKKGAEVEVSITLSIQLKQYLSLTHRHHLSHNRHW